MALGLNFLPHPHSHNTSGASFIIPFLPLSPIFIWLVAVLAVGSPNGQFSLANGDMAKLPGSWASAMKVAAPSLPPPSGRYNSMLAWSILSVLGSRANLARLHVRIALLTSGELSRRIYVETAPWGLRRITERGSMDGWIIFSITSLVRRLTSAFTYSLSIGRAD